MFSAIQQHRLHNNRTIFLWRNVVEQHSTHHLGLESRNNESTVRKIPILLHARQLPVLPNKHQIAIDTFPRSRFKFLFMIPWLLLVLAPLSTIAAVDKTLGVVPDLISHYITPKSGSWKCLDGSKDIPWSAVNNDYCDCPDGSDEPGWMQCNFSSYHSPSNKDLKGTSACPNNTFYCRNEGHIGGIIPSSRVNDGLCGV